MALIPRYKWTDSRRSKGSEMDSNPAIPSAWRISPVWVTACSGLMFYGSIGHQPKGLAPGSLCYPCTYQHLVITGELIMFHVSRSYPTQIVIGDIKLYPYNLYTHKYIYIYIYNTDKYYTYISTYVCIYIYTLGALGFRRLSCLSLIQMSKITVSPQRNADFAHSSSSFFNDNSTDIIF